MYLRRNVGGKHPRNIYEHIYEKRKEKLTALIVKMKAKPAEAKRLRMLYKGMGDCRSVIKAIRHIKISKRKF